MSAALFPAGVPKSKRLFDLLLTIPGAILISPVFALLALVVRWRLGSPVLFVQIRPGLRGEPFKLYKFRTMTEERDETGKSLPDEARLTRVGRFLRSFSLDELPEVVNVLRGEMSLVGPRPLLMAYLGRYTPEQGRRHEVLPGMTGWAQVNGRNAINWEQRFALDVWYVDHWSLFLDVKILGLTALKALTREGVTPVGQATSDEFTGSFDFAQDGSSDPARGRSSGKLE
jgi:sugar transferase EpsL